MPRPSISACLIVKNEEENLSRCLKSLLGAVDEIVVVDTGSTDRTVEVARDYGARLGEFAWCDDFAAARNAALDLARSEWVLSIDADEWFANDGTRAFVRRAVRIPGELAFAPQTRLENGYEYWSLPRLFRREGSRWEHRVHEHIRTASPETQTVFDPAFLLFHSGIDGVTPSGKQDRYQRLLNLQLAESAPGSRAYEHALVYLARFRKDPLSAEDIEVLKEALRAAIAFDEAGAQLFTLRLYRHWLATGDFEEIDRLNAEAWERGARGPLNHCARAVGFLEAGDQRQARAALDEAERVEDIVNARGKLAPLFADLRRMIEGMG